MKAYPRSFLAWFWSLLALVVVTGVVLLPGMLALRLEWDVPQGWLPSNRVLWAAAHGLLAFLTLLLFGSLLPLHVRHGLRQRKNRGTGIALLFALPVLILSGWGIYYLSNEDVARWTSELHVLIALPISVLVGWHAWRAHRIHEESRSRHIK
jgi:hypothetical protein